MRSGNKLDWIGSSEWLRSLRKWMDGWMAHIREKFHEFLINSFWVFARTVSHRLTFRQTDTAKNNTCFTPACLVRRQKMWTLYEVRREHRQVWWLILYCFVVYSFGSMQQASSLPKITNFWTHFQQKCWTIAVFWARYRSPAPAHYNQRQPATATHESQLYILL